MSLKTVKKFNSAIKKYDKPYYLHCNNGLGIGCCWEFGIWHGIDDTKGKGWSFCILSRFLTFSRWDLGCVIS